MAYILSPAASALVTYHDTPLWMTSSNVGFDRGYGKRPDGMTVFPFSMGKCLILDCTCVDSFSHSALALTATEPGSASRSAEVRKNLMYEGLCDGYIFQAIAIETSCVFGRDTNAFISRLGHLATSVSGERREAEFLRQRLSLATVRGNAQYVTQAGRPSSWIGIALCYMWIPLCYVYTMYISFSCL